MKKMSKKVVQHAEAVAAAPDVGVSSVLLFRQAMHANEDGIVSAQEVAFTFDPTWATFTAEQPKHYTAIVSENDWCGSGPYFPSLDLAVAKYEELSDRYSKWRLRQRAEPNMLWIGRMSSSPSGFAVQYLGVNATLGIGMQRVGKFTDTESGELVLFNEDGTLALGLVRNAEREKMPIIVVPDTPEIRAKVEAMVESIKTARALLDGIADAPDPVAYLLAMPFSVPAKTVDLDPMPHGHQDIGDDDGSHAAHEAAKTVELPPGTKQVSVKVETDNPTPAAEIRPFDED